MNTLEKRNQQTFLLQRKINVKEHFTVENSQPEHSEMKTSISRTI